MRKTSKILVLLSLLLCMYSFSNDTKKVDTNEIVSVKKDEIQKGYVRIHFEDVQGGTGLWIWGGVKNPTQNWPTGQIKFISSNKDEFGTYIDIEKSSKLSDIGYLILKNGDKVTEKDQSIKLPTSDINEVWIDKDFKVYLDEPLKEKNIFRVHYQRKDMDYNNKSLWFWNDTLDNPTKWPNGKKFIKGKNGIYVDVKLAKDAKKVGFLILDNNKQGDDVKIIKKDLIFEDVKNFNQVYLKDEDPTIYTNHYFIKDVRLKGATHISENKIELQFTTLKDMGAEDLMDNIKLVDVKANPVKIDDIDVKGNVATIKGDFSINKGPYKVSYEANTFITNISWQLKDSIYSYDGPLGANLSKDGKKVDVYLWAPSADNVKILIYDKDDMNKLIDIVELQKGKKGVWQKTLISNSKIKNFNKYFYSFEITRGENKVIVLDPYAKSLAIWDKSKGANIAKASFVNPSNIGIKNLKFAKLNKDKTIIYEVHVRDFTSDSNLKLKAPFGTFKAFIEKLDYIKSLGVTHIQLLPILSYYNIDESNRKRSNDYLDKNTNYNWGYDPQNYFSLSGVYATNPNDPENRIKEFKELVSEIHKRGMGVILDVVYNHTARTSIFEDLEPRYYHFMDEKGNTKTSFGGGRLASTHYMTRRLMIDSIKYLMNEYKVDGFRFDMMGDHDAKTMQMIADNASKINKNVVLLGEGWKTYVGDDGQKVKPSDQDWMKDTNSVAVFSDDIRNVMKSGFPEEGKPAFLTGNKENINRVFENIKANPTNFVADDPQDVIQYVEAHDNLTLFDIIAVSTKLDPSIKENFDEIEKRAILGNMIVLTSQGIPFIHAGQEYGRTKQVKVDVKDNEKPEKIHYVKGFKYPYFINDSYNAPDRINRLDWERIKNSRMVEYTKGLIKIRKSTDAFTLKTKNEIEKNVKLITSRKEDNAIAYEVSGKKDTYLVLINADNKERVFKYENLKSVKVIADAETSSITPIKNPKGVRIEGNKIILDKLTGAILKIK